MGLKEYQKKRHFNRTEEPEGKVASSPSGRLYVIQKHAASRLHYDFRLELNGVLKSWAVPKGPSLNPSEKHLAVHVEDHPIEYGDFEGVIPEDQYGGGTVMVWDKGEWEPLGDPQEGYEQGKLKFRLKGKKLKGEWVLARMSEKSGETGRNWLLMKKKDDYARKDSDFDAVSAVSGRSMDEIARDRDRVWSSSEATGPSASTSSNPSEELPTDIASLPGIRRQAFPRKAAPQLATLVKSVPENDDWLHEVKYDGYRILAFKTNSGVRLLTRNEKDWTHRFPLLEKEIAALPFEDFLMDGEIVVMRSDGRTDFQALQNMLKGISTGRMVYFAFDLIYFMGYDLSRTPLIHRKELLRSIVDSVPSKDVLRFSEHIRGRGGAVYQEACRHKLEGIVSKRIDSPYRQQRSRDWVKSKCLNRQEFVVAGFTRPSGSRTGFGALLLAVYSDSGELMYAGRVGTGFNEKTLQELSERLKALEQRTAPVSNPPAGSEAKGVHWVKPGLVAEVEFTEWTNEGILRHPSFKGIREDKDAKEVVREAPSAGPNARTDAPVSGDRRNTSSRGASVQIAGVRISSPGKVLYPDQGITKAELAGYYEWVADRMLPYIAGRPLTLVRCPQGRQKKCFYQKHLSEQLPDPVKGIPIREKQKKRMYMTISDRSGLMALVQLGVLEIHPWGSREDRVERPDIMTFDLDPGPGIGPDDLAEGCRMLKAQLENIGLTSFLKTSGGKGFHVVVPLVRRSEWDEIKSFSGAVAKHLARNHPDTFTAVMSKAKRHNKLFVDYLRNARGATSVAPFSTRARPGAPVSTPIGWDELGNTAPDAYTVKNLPARLKSEKKDPWSDFFSIRQSVTVPMKKKFGLR
ncbi:MAG: DNA ligase D [Desulfobacterales bacterium]